MLLLGVMVLATGLGCSRPQPAPGERQEPITTTPADPTEAEGETEEPMNEESHGWIGTWRLVFEPDAGWHVHHLQLVSNEDGRWVGKVFIDQGIGPEARMPNPDERTFALMFDGEEKGEVMTFEVKVGSFEPTRYAFALRLCEAGREGCGAAPPGQPRWITGKVTVHGPRTKDELAVRGTAISEDDAPIGLDELPVEPSTAR